jgi:hypothetical protein
MGLRAWNGKNGTIAAQQVSAVAPSFSRFLPAADTVECVTFRSLLVAVLCHVSFFSFY